jgi:leucyl-tRNA synthetase
MLIICLCLTACVALTPLIVTAYPIPDILWSRGLRQDEDAMIRQRSLADITEKLFSNYISTIFISYLMAVRDRIGFQNETAVLLMDTAIPQTSERVWQILCETHILAITFPVHTTSLFQAFDLVSFGVLNKLKVSATGELDDDSVNAQISKLIQASEQTATSSTIIDRSNIQKFRTLPDFRWLTHKQ